MKMFKNKLKYRIKAHPSVLSLIGNTPLIKLKKIVKDFNGNFFTKLEAFNPGHSNKDRIALNIILEAEKMVFFHLVVQL